MWLKECLYLISVNRGFWAATKLFPASRTITYNTFCFECSLEVSDMIRLPWEHIQFPSDLVWQVSCLVVGFIKPTTYEKFLDIIKITRTYFSGIVKYEVSLWLPLNYVSRFRYKFNRKIPDISSIKHTDGDFRILL